VKVLRTRHSRAPLAFQMVTLAPVFTPHRGSSAGADRTLDLDCTACSFELGDPRQHCRRTRHDKSRKLLLLLPPHDVAVSCSALGGVGTEVTIYRGPSCEGNSMATLDTGKVDSAIAGRPREDADHVFHELTRSICPSCRKVIDAKILLRDDKVYMSKRCPDCGPFTALIYSDAKAYTSFAPYCFRISWTHGHSTRRTS